MGDTNVAYAFHFYCGTHGRELRARAETALAAGLCLFASEWGAVECTGDGAVHQSVDEWMAFLRRHGISHTSWAVSDKAEGASILLPGASAAIGVDGCAWTDEHLTESGRKVRSILLLRRGRCVTGQTNRLRSNLELDVASRQLC